MTIGQTTVTYILKWRAVQTCVQKFAKCSQRVELEHGSQLYFAIKGRGRFIKRKEEEESQLQSHLDTNNTLAMRDL